VIWHIVPILDGGYVHESDICLVRAGLETLCSWVLYMLPSLVLTTVPH
jgi:hypothetical protein